MVFSNQWPNTVGTHIHICVYGSMRLTLGLLSIQQVRERAREGDERGVEGLHRPSLKSCCCCGVVVASLHSIFKLEGMDLHAGPGGYFIYVTMYVWARVHTKWAGLFHFTFFSLSLFHFICVYMCVCVCVWMIGWLKQPVLTHTHRLLCVLARTYAHTHP